MRRLPDCPDCRSSAWRNSSSGNGLLVCRICGSRWVLELLVKLAAVRSNSTNITR